MKPDILKRPPSTSAFAAGCLLLALAQVSVCAEGGSEGSANAGPSLIVDQARVDNAVLFAFDDNSIPFTDNLQLSMEAPEKYAGNPVLTIGRDGDPDEWQLQYYGSVVRANGKFMMWYDAVAREGFSTSARAEDWRGWRFAYAESKDGIHWIKPDLGLTEFRGSRHNNLIQLPDGFRGYHILVRYEPEEADRSRRFKMLLLVRRTGEYKVPGATADENIFMPMYSPDGLRWRVADELLPDGGKVISPKFHLLEDMEGSGLYKWKGMYYATSQSWGKAGRAAMAPYGRHIQIWRSADFLNWSETQTMGFARQGEFRRPTEFPPGATLQAGTSNGANEQTHEGASVWNRGNVLIGITGLWHGVTDWADLTHDLGLLISNDGLHYREPQPDFLFARIGKYGRDWDYRGLSQGQGFENVGDRTYIWYGAPVDQTEGYRTGRPFLRHGGVGLLMLDRDRFGSLSTRDPDRDGSLITSEIGAAGRASLWINAEGLGPESRLRVEVLDASERPIPGYAGGEAAIAERSGLRVPVSWNGRDRIDCARKTFKIRAAFEGAERNAIRLYALYLSRVAE